MLLVLSHLQEALHSLHPHFPTVETLGILVTQKVFGTFLLWQQTPCHRLKFGSGIKILVSFQCSEMVSLSNGCLKNDCICRSFRARHRTENFERHVRSDQTSFWLLQTKKREKKKITYSKVIMPKQVGLIIPRGPFLNLEWFVGLLKGDNWIHTELAAGMHTQSAAECECSRPGIVSHPEICTYKSQCPCTTPHKWLQWKGRDRVGTGSWVTHPLVPARRRPTFLWENLWNARVNSHVCTWASRTI